MRAKLKRKHRNTVSDTIAIRRRIPSNESTADISQCLSFQQVCRLHWIINVGREITGTTAHSLLKVDLDGMPPGSKSAVLAMGFGHCSDLTGRYTEPVGTDEGRQESANLNFKVAHASEAFGVEFLANYPTASIQPSRAVSGEEISSLLMKTSRALCIKFSADPSKTAVKSLHEVLGPHCKNVAGYTTLHCKPTWAKYFVVFTTRFKAEIALDHLQEASRLQAHSDLLGSEWGFPPFIKRLNVAHGIHNEGKSVSQVCM